MHNEPQTQQINHGEDETVRVLGIEVHRHDMDGAVARIWGWLRAGAYDCRYVVTPNLDHARMHRTNAALRAAYRDAALVLADGMPFVWTSRLLRRPLPERVAGSSLVPAVLARAFGGEPLRLFLLGGGPGVAEAAAARVEAAYEGVRCVGCHAPPRGFERDGHALETIARTISDAGPDLLIIGLGAPKQELWVHRERHRLRAKVAVCAGATIDFLAGTISRAPAWMQKSGLEWLHRAASEPGRLLPRYARDALAFPGLLYRDVRAARAVRG